MVRLVAEGDARGDEAGGPVVDPEVVPAGCRGIGDRSCVGGAVAVHAHEFAAPTGLNEANWRWFCSLPLSVRKLVLANPASPAFAARLFR